MNSIHLVIPDLFLPQDFVGEVGKGLKVPALEKLLSRGIASRFSTSMNAEVSMESMLCKAYGLENPEDVPIAGISALFDQLGEGHWLRADPVHLSLHRDRLMLLEVTPTLEEATLIGKSLNEHLSEEGMVVFAPNSKRWYVRFEEPQRISSPALSKVVGANVRGLMAGGEDAARWYKILNEIQMLLYSHPVNEAREEHGELPINSMWLWGGGPQTIPSRHYDHVTSDDAFPEMFAAPTGARFTAWARKWGDDQCKGRQLLVWTRLRAALQCGDLQAWRNSLQDFEVSYAQPLLEALRTGEIESLHMDIPSGENTLSVDLTRLTSRTFWRRTRPLASYSIV